ncbi:cation diffusion facilitator family transporter [Wolinella succinogenes]|uniref:TRANSMEMBRANE TRANSPORT PROTEIN-Predicted Co/Zn/Cd cation transport n=1 Tax=Wolinella succinogenes (strain ATCC 29543 / DSM 1740 / CCUG 13145 / JCM 31913 / LMG 7466 / NCTC 11488 / FDC 602W) TaxID=273121 RepID=Q7M8H2_WOLSU|nr:cation diffusion facilitator family transporter [Wolinella succinogenes]NLU34724.1 cation transporter [Wolinella succinogenes]CAE10691.1 TRANSMEMBRANE TRANSPORT PROTEIN-Predicted Co/Zn/Cd cation transport [Wolinella succinogenes]VEG80838.1 Ferrous-iron efflux pump FieF [Wolinella succinogenes]HCZ18635.1 cation transporter [Helicobacter sp.]
MTLQKKATLISSLTAGTLAIIKFVVGLASGSVAVLASAIDSILDLTISLFNYVALHNSEKPADETFNYGRGKIEALASVIEGTIITLSGLFILYESIQKLYYGEEVSHLTPSIIVMGISFVVTLALVLFLLYVAKKSQNMVIKADALHYQTDLLSNGVILFSLGFIAWTEYHFIDGVLGILIAFYIIYSAYGLIKEGVWMLLDKAMDEEMTEKIRSIIAACPEVSSFHHLKTREAGSDRFVDVHLVFGREFMLVEAHAVSDRIEAAIEALDQGVRWSITVHLDPFDDS